MLPSFLITIREVIEASLIVATILGILVKLGMKNKIRTVWYATASALGLCLLLLAAASIAGLRIQELYTGRTEELIEGVLMIISALFITWAVFFLHKYFAQYKTHLLSKIKSSVEMGKQSGLFMLVFTAVFREGFEIVLFLSTIYLSSNPGDIFIKLDLAGLNFVSDFFRRLQGLCQMDLRHREGNIRQLRMAHVLHDNVDVNPDFGDLREYLCRDPRAVGNRADRDLRIGLAAGDAAHGDIF